MHNTKYEGFDSIRIPCPLENTIEDRSMNKPVQYCFLDTNIHAMPFDRKFGRKGAFSFASRPSAARSNAFIITSVSLDRIVKTGVSRIAAPNYLMSVSRPGLHDRSLYTRSQLLNLLYIRLDSSNPSHERRQGRQGDMF